MEDLIYTLGVWRVKPSQEAEFIAAWKPLESVFSNLVNSPGFVTVIQDVSDSTRFYSFAPWNRLEDVDTMRDDPIAQAGIRHLMELCTEATPGTFRVVVRMSMD